MILEKIYGFMEKYSDKTTSLLINNKKSTFILASILTVAVAVILSYFSRDGFRLFPAIMISLFLILIYSNILNASKNYKKAITFVFILSFLFQIYLAAQFIGVEHDINNRRSEGETIDKAGNIYREVNPYYTPLIYGKITPYFKSEEEIQEYNKRADYYYPPTRAWTAFLVLKLSELTSIKFSTMIKMPMILTTFLIGILLYKIMIFYKKGPKEIYKTMAFYLFNPLTIMVSGYHGQDDNLGIIFLVLFFYYLLKSQKINFFSALLLGLSLVVKPVAAPVLPYFVSKQKKLLKMAMFGIIVIFPYLFLIATYPYSPLFEKLKGTLLYGGVKYLWGYSRVENYFTTSFNLPGLHTSFSYVYPAITILLFGGMFLYFLKNKRINYLDGIIISNLFFFVFTSGFGLQYFMWMLPFAVLKANEHKFRYFYYIFSILSGLMALVFYYGNANTYYFIRDAIGYSIIGITLWIFIIFWWAWYLKIGVNEKPKQLPTQ